MGGTVLAAVLAAAATAVVAVPSSDVARPGTSTATTIDASTFDLAVDAETGNGTNESLPPGARPDDAIGAHGTGGTD